MRTSLIASFAFVCLTASVSQAADTVVSTAGGAHIRVAGASANLNAIRRAANMPLLRENPRLSQAARKHAADMHRNGLKGHRGSDGSRTKQRVAATGYRPCGTAENVAWGTWTTASVMRAWSQSPKHRDNMLNPIVREFGYAAVGDRQVLVFAKSC